jgi:C4-dicarboxylate-specific signal transduction histidine kinase
MEPLGHVYGLAHPVFSASGEVVEVVGTTLDVTERKRAEEDRERLHQLQADLERINRVTTMGELTASLAHEINQPIAAAVTNARICVRWLARDIPDIEEAREAAARIAKDATRAAEIITRVRELFKKRAPQRELVAINEMINEIVALLRSEAMRHAVSIGSEFAPDLPNVPADCVELQQVLMNLIINAIEAMKTVERRRELTLSSQRDGSDQLRVSVSDTGVGLPPEGDQIFDPFFTTKPAGTGMGLAISRSIIESPGERLWATANTRPGVTFHLTLPITLEAHP